MSISTHIFRVEGMHSGSCALLIDDALTDLPGVRHTWTTNGRSIVSLDDSDNSIEDVVGTITALGHQAFLLP